jgi:hypothetical protein
MARLVTHWRIERNRFGPRSAARIASGPWRNTARARTYCERFLSEVSHDFPTPRSVVDRHGPHRRREAGRGTLDADNDGTVDLAEAKKAAADLFDKLDTDNEGTLSLKELHGRVSHGDLVSADPDHDQTLTKDEYLAVVERRFKAADKDNDGTLSSWELHSLAGRALVRLLR